MSNDLRTLALFTEANPVPDESKLETFDVEPAAYLATLQQRSSEVIEIDEKTDKQTRKRSGWWIAAAAAALVMVAGILAVVLQQGGGEEPPPATDPTPSTTIAPTSLSPAGFWVVDEVRHLALLEDGSYSWQSVGFVSDRGTWQRAGDTLTFRSNADSESCLDNAAGTVVFEMADIDSLTVTFRTDECDAERDIAPLVGSRTFSRTETFEVPEPRSPEDVAWDQLPFLNAPAGEYAKLPNFRPALAFESQITLVPGIGDVGDDFAPLFLSSQADIDAAIFFQRLDETTVETQRIHFSETEGFELLDSTEVTVDTAPGHRLHLRVIESTRLAGDGAILQPGIEYITYVFDVKGEVVVVIASLAEIADEPFDQIVTSIDWKDLQN